MLYSRDQSDGFLVFMEVVQYHSHFPICKQGIPQSVLEGHKHFKLTQLTLTCTTSLFPNFQRLAFPVIHVHVQMFWPTLPKTTLKHLGGAPVGRGIFIFGLPLSTLHDMWA